MIVTHTLSNFLSSFQNHAIAKKLVMRHKNTQLIIRLLDVFIQEGLIRGYKLLPQQQLLIYLKYQQNKPFFSKIQILSKPGKRLYIKTAWFQKNAKFGLYIISTSLGFLTDRQARQLNVGGELICRIF